MSDDTNDQESGTADAPASGSTADSAADQTAAIATPPASPEGGWNGPPTGGSTPPPPPPVDATGALPAPSASTGASLNVNIENPLALLLGAVAVVGIVLGLLIKSEGVKLWDTMGWTWALLAIVAAAIPLLASLSGLIPAPKTAMAQAATVCAGVMVLWWVLFVLPHIERNNAFLATLGTLATVGSAWALKPKDQ